MKRLIIYWENFKTTWVSNLAILILLTISIYFFVDAYGIFRAEIDTYTRLKNADTENMVYFEEKQIVYNSENYVNEYRALASEIENFAAVDYVDMSFSGYVNFEGEQREELASLNVVKEQQKVLYPVLKKGEWPLQGVNEDGSLNAVVSGKYLYGHTKVGDVITVKLNRQEHVEIKIKIAGILPYPCYMPYYGGGGSTIAADSLFANYDTILVYDGELMQSLMDQYPGSFGVDRNFMVKFDADASEEDLEEAMQFLRNRGAIHPVSEILNQSKIELAESFKSVMLQPIFFLFTTFLAFISMMILSIYKRIQDHSVFYLVGCSKKRIMVDMTIQIGIISLISGLLNLLYVLNYSKLVAMDVIHYDVVFLVFDNQVIWVVVGIILAIYLLTVCVAMSIMKKRSPVDMLRKFEN